MNVLLIMGNSYHLLLIVAPPSSPFSYSVVKSEIVSLKELSEN